MNPRHQAWKAVIEGFGTRIWLARNLEDELRERISKTMGKFTRRVPPANKNAKDTEKEADLMPLDAWGRWSELRVALGRLHGFTYWFPVPIEIPRTPLGEVLPGGDPWADSEAQARAAAQDALKVAELPEWCLQVSEGIQVFRTVPVVSPESTADAVAGHSLDTASGNLRMGLERAGRVGGPSSPMDEEGWL